MKSVGLDARFLGPLYEYIYTSRDVPATANNKGEPEVRLEQRISVGKETNVVTWQWLRKTHAKPRNGNDREKSQDELHTRDIL
jgi:hypothetical protein